MSAEVAIRRLAYADLPQVVAIERRAFPAPWSLAMFVLELSKPSGVPLVAEIVGDPASGGHVAASGTTRPSGEVAGYLICSRFDTVWHLMDIAVDPGRQRRGIGSAMLRALLGEVGEDARLTLEVRRSNAGAIALYERFGFLVAGTRRRYYADNGEDALIMWRTPATLRGALDDIPAAGPVR
ncbi:MAG TPA: GNAT family N-acetyltransferase [Solirubrobacteraceae bacterium]|nr:GNAT family N-acetyltransferase [Solirubrobacteraceae bacterium]